MVHVSIKEDYQQLFRKGVKIPIPMIKSPKNGCLNRQINAIKLSF
jgi:hypothetical protein